MKVEDRISDLERVVAMLISAQCEEEPAAYYRIEDDLPIRFVFRKRLEDGGLDVSFESA